MIDPEPRLRSQVIAEIRIGNPPYPQTLDPSQPGNGVVDVEAERAPITYLSSLLAFVPRRPEINAGRRMVESRRRFHQARG